MKKYFLCSLLLSVAFVTHSQISNTPPPELEKPKSNIGLGIGLDYGGIGAKITGALSQNLGLFGGFGYNLAGIGFNGGLVVNLSPKTKVQPVLLGMYGYNAVILLKSGTAVVKRDTYYGPSFGFGLQFHGRNENGNFFNIELLFPVRNSDYEDDIHALKSQSNISLKEPPPVAISLGYHFGI